MLIRYGFYEGQVRSDRQPEFDAHFRDVVIPGLARMPGIVSVRLLRGIPQGSVEPRFHHIIELTCRDEDALVEAMQSQQRRALQSGPWGVMDFYEGATPHANFIVTASLEGTGASTPTGLPRAAATARTPAGLARVGRPGMEKTVLVYDDGQIRDVSIFVSEVDRALIGSDWTSAVAALDSERMPWVDPSARRGPCIEYHRRIIAIEAVDACSAKPVRAALRAGRLAGAKDALALPGTHAFTCRAGIAAIVGAGSPDPVVSGVCLFLSAQPGNDSELDAQTRAVVASSPGLVSLGPLLVGLNRWQAESDAIRLAINGAEIEQVTMEAGFIEQSVRHLSRKVALETGDVVLVNGLAPQGVARERKLVDGDLISVTTPALGTQERRCS